MSVLFEEASRTGLPITPLISDVICSTPAFGFMSRQFPSLMERAKADLVLCLGLMHHIHITGRQSLDRIAQLVASLADKHALFEFVANDDDNNVLITANRTIDYNLESVKESLGSVFSSVEERPSDRKTRKLLLCTK